MEAKNRAINEQKKLFWITVGYVAALLIIMGVLSYLLWNRGTYTIAWVPVAVLEWSFLGGMTAVLYRIAYRQNIRGIRLYCWIIAKPIIGLIMGSVIYFVALGGGRLLGANLLNEDGQIKDLNTILWVNALAFIGGFSDRFSVDLIDRITGGFLEKEKPDKESSEREANDNNR